ncbi:PhzF family phenazine biosynthesis protein [Chitinimonas sp.]|uniref:PhzF family phenazine biosynthesis protein n=1 Tax=Chitinimonas sp. TaxID=1934313 RepID=UPI0035B11D01
MQTLSFSLVDVFACQILSGNSLSIFEHDAPLSVDLMQRLTREMRQFESIFVQRLGDARLAARIFTMEEELPFAGHPVIGAAAYWHARHAPDAQQLSISMQLGERSADIVSRRDGDSFFAEMDQGRAEFGAPLSEAESAMYLSCFGLDAADREATLPLQVVSTGLPYLILPIRSGLARARIEVADLEARLAAIGAKFAFVLDVAAREGRTWDNDGRVEDIATGSAAGPAAAYLYAHGCLDGEAVTLHQGRFLGRPSELHARILRQGEARHVMVGGQVWMVGEGQLRIPA